MDVAFIASFALAAPMTLLADFSRRQTRTTESHSGILAQTAGGMTTAWLNASQTARGGGGGSTRTAGDSVIGNFHVIVHDEWRGWPLVTTIIRPPARLDIDIVDEPKVRLDVPRDTADPRQQAIERILEADERFTALEARRQAGPVTTRQWWAWFPAIGAWWVILFAAAAISIQCLRFGSLWLRGRSAERAYRRRAQNKCAACGYDLTGLDFNDKCPECGAAVW